MLIIVKKYIKRKPIKKEIEHVNDDMIAKLYEVVLHFGEDVFNRKKSSLSQHTIENTIPMMLKHNIKNIKENLLKLKSTNRNSLEHYELIYGLDAEIKYQERTNKSLQTLDNFISRHGDIKGSKLWNDYIEIKKIQNSLISFQKRHGNELGKQNYNLFIERLRYKNTIECYIEKHGKDFGEELYHQRYPNHKNTKIYKNYKQAVYRASQKTYDKHKDKINPNNHTRTRMGIKGGWQLDHIISIRECFDTNISIEEASNINNLRMLTWKENMKRNRKC